MNSDTLLISITPIPPRHRTPVLTRTGRLGGVGLDLGTGCVFSSQTQDFMGPVNGSWVSDKFWTIMAGLLQ